MGDLGEQWTASELRKLRGKGWLVVNHVLLRRWDIDHVLVGPGGAYAVETKWSAQTWRINPSDPDVRDAVDQARQNAHDLVIWSDFKRAVGEVRPLVVLWGEAHDDSPDISLVDGVTVVRGRALDVWRDSLFGNRLTADQVDAAWVLLDSKVRQRDPIEDATPPPSVGRLAATLSLAVVTAFVALYVAAELMTSTGSTVWAALASVGLGGLAVPAYRWKQTRYLALGWGTGMFAGLAVIIIATAIA